MAEEKTAAPNPWLGRLALALAALLLLVVVLTLPFALRSMWVELIEGQEALQYDGLTGEVVSFTEGDATSSDQSFVTIAVVDIDEAAQTATLSVSGHRDCTTDCPALTLTMFSLSDAARRRGLPPSATLDFPPEEHVFSRTAQLPLRGNPNVYPFDTYQLWLGLVLTAVLPDGTLYTAQPADVRNGNVFTLQDNVAGLNMAPPVVVDPQSVQTDTDPFAFLVVQRLDFERPAYQQLLAVLLVVLISTSAALALFIRAVNDLVLGIGGLILGIWGVRSVVVPAPPAAVNAVNVALACVILLLLVALAVRTARHYHRLSQLPAVRRRRAAAVNADEP